MTSAIFGVDLDVVGTTLVRLTCSAYVGYALLVWLAREVSDPRASRAIAAANAVAWGLSGLVIAFGLLTGLAAEGAWLIVGMQGLFALAWALALFRVERVSSSSTSMVLR
jgi:heme A synthase